MTGRIDAKLKALGIDLPTPPAPVASYVPYVRTGDLVFVSGQVTIGPKGLEYVGIVGKDFTTDEGKAAARLCAVNLIAQARAACGGDLDRVKRVVKLLGFVNATADFKDHPKVINGASDLMVEIFGDKGRHARSAVAAPSLPFGISTEVEAIIEIE